MSTVSSPEKPRAIYTMLHEQFTGTKIGDVPEWGSLYRITRPAR
jgi:hypothetical protein